MSTQPQPKKINARIKLKGETADNWRQAENLYPIKNEMILVHDKGNAIVITEDGNNKSVAELIKNPPYFFPVLKGTGKYSVVEGREANWEYKKYKLCTTSCIGPIDTGFYNADGPTRVILTLTIPNFNKLSPEEQRELQKLNVYYTYPVYCKKTDSNSPELLNKVEAWILNSQLSDDGTILTIVSENVYPQWTRNSEYTPMQSTYKDVTFYTTTMTATTPGAAADAAFSHVEGNNNIIDGNSIAAHAEGEDNKAAGAPYAHLEGRNNRIQGSQVNAATFNSVHIEGSNNVVSGHKIAGAHVEGMANKAHNERAHAEGFRTIANGDQSHTEGLDTRTYNSAAHAEGVDTKAYGRGSHTEGLTTTALTNYSHAEGEGTLAGSKGYYWEAIELQKNDQGKVIGGVIYLTPTQLKKGQFPKLGEGKTYDNLIPGYTIGDTIAIVNDNKHYTQAKITSIDHSKITFDGDIGFTEIKKIIDGDAERELDEYSISVILKPDPVHPDSKIKAASLKPNAHVEGVANSATGAGSHAEGGGCLAYGDYSHAEGKYTKASYSAHAEGTQTQALGQRSHAEGTETMASGNSSHTEGTRTYATNYNAHAEGSSSVSAANKQKDLDHLTANELVDIWNQTSNQYYRAFNLAAGHSAHSEGIDTLADGQGAHAEGQKTRGQGKYSHAEGKYTIAKGEGAHAEGVGGSGNHTSARSDKKVYQYTSQASGKAMHVEGNGCEATGKEGNHAEGRFTKAIGEWSCHAEGYLSRATANHAHAEGFDTEAGGQASHAEGRFNTVSKDHTASHVQGEGNVTTAAHQFLGGKYSDPQTDTLVAFGWGSGENGIATTKKNALELKKDGTLIVNALQIGGVNILPIADVEFPGGDA